MMSKLLFLFNPFCLKASESELTKNINLCRVLLGLSLIHRYVDIYGFSFLVESADESIYLKLFIAIALSVLLTVGLFTPVVIVGLLFFAITSQFAFTLGNMVTTIVLWGLFFLGAGRAYSLDYLLWKLSPINKLLSWVYCFACDLKDELSIAKIRFVLIFLFWGICFAAVSYHFYDSFWLKGKVLQLFFTTPYLTDYYGCFISFRNHFPVLFNLFCTVGLYVQGFWELFLLPLMYVRWLRPFVVIQGYLFFIISLICMNLGYLPFVEICFWMLLFNYSSVWKSLLSPFSEQPVLKTNQTRSNKTISYFVIVGCFIALLHALMNLSTIGLINNSVADTVRNIQNKLKTVFFTFGQGGVNVFNKADLNMGSAHFVVYETDKEGNILRVVPFIDINGGRLDYLRNDILYFRLSVAWQRMARERKFLNGNYSTPSELTKQFALQVAVLDALLTEEKQQSARYYNAALFVKDMIEEPLFTSWSQPRNTANIRIILSEEDLIYLKKKFKHVFDLPPGHAFSDMRLQETKEAVVLKFTRR